MFKKTAVIASISASLILGVSVPAMASGLNIISGNSVITGKNIFQITPNMVKSYQPPAATTTSTSVTSTLVTPTTTVSTQTTVPTVTVGTSEISLKGLLHNNVSSINGVVQQNPIPVTIVPSTLVMATSMTDDEQQMVDLINQDRVRNGLPTLKVDLRLVSAARAKSEDIKANKYFTHVSPNFGYTASLFPQMGLNVNYWAENVGSQRTVVAAEAALEADIGHQQNLLDPHISYVGVGIAYNSIYGNVYTQEFVKE